MIHALVGPRVDTHSYLGHIAVGKGSKVHVGKNDLMRSS
jgi:hypothetical protein